MSTPDPHSLFQALHSMGSGEFVHLNGSLAQHLIGTAALLEAWQAPRTVRTAGLFHAAYGTAGFETSLTPHSASARQQIAELIGADAEQLVYLYGCCHRQRFYPNIGTDLERQWPDRFTGEVHLLPSAVLSHLCEITAANELEIASHSAAFRLQHGAPLWELFQRMGPHLSQHARAFAAQVLADHTAGALSTPPEHP